jgi:hypothetical protein
MTKDVYEDVVKIPQGDDLDRVLESYRRLGLPGCIGSMDCTHIHWRQCWKEKATQCTGKEGYPTLSFQVVVDHSRMIRHCSSFYYGATNDISISNTDPFCLHLRRGKFRDVEYELIDKNGTIRSYKGGWLVVDGGYLKLSVFIDPQHRRFHPNEIMFSEWLESVRKDVECTFGMLKSRFRLLWNGVVYHYTQDIEMAMKTACILHNLILTYDGQSLASWENIDWQTLHPDEDEEGGEVQKAREAEGRKRLQAELQNEEEIRQEAEQRAEEIRDANIIEPCRTENLEAAHEWDLLEYHPRRDALAENFCQSFDRGMVGWPKGFSGERRKTLTIEPQDCAGEVLQ